ncbi:50S ribosomal protein L30 [Thiohalorhabdus methylotrophus]|uniref:Large ribosomal subunit protein uL30 n=1 Tax=Thiohalorhabdus methylotrophus TaxID=3242694 RepID=A0ABV4TQQ3_9GAMM
MAGTIRITLTKSPIGSQQKHRATLRGLGLRRLNHTVEREDTPQVRGMARSVAHLVKVEE